MITEASPGLICPITGTGFQVGDTAVLLQVKPSLGYCRLIAPPIVAEILGPSRGKIIGVPKIGRAQQGDILQPEYAGASAFWLRQGALQGFFNTRMEPQSAATVSDVCAAHRLRMEDVVRLLDDGGPKFQTGGKPLVVASRLSPARRLMREVLVEDLAYADPGVILRELVNGGETPAIDTYLQGLVVWNVLRALRLRLVPGPVRMLPPVAQPEPEKPARPAWLRGVIVNDDNQLEKT